RRQCRGLQRVLENFRPALVERRHRRSVLDNVHFFRIEPSTPRSILRPSCPPALRAADLASASSMPSRRPLPNTASLTALPQPEPCVAGASDLPVAPGEGAGASAACARVRCVRISQADSRSTAVSYLPPTGERARIVARSASVIAPMRQLGGTINARSTGNGTPPSCRVETSASP